MAGLQSDVVDTVSDTLHDCTVFSVEEHGYSLIIRARHNVTGEERAVELNQEVCFNTMLICAKVPNA